MTTRQFQPDDLKLFLAMSSEFLRESPVFKDVPDFSVNKVCDFYDNLLYSDAIFARVGFVNEVPAGMVICKRVDFIFSHCNFTHDVIFYVRPEFRGGFLLKRFLKEFEDWSFADDRCVWLQLNALANENNERVAKLVEALGYPRVGVIHVKRRT